MFIHGISQTRLMGLAKVPYIGVVEKWVNVCKYAVSGVYPWQLLYLGREYSP